ncbi:MAG: hypothetical protein U0414_06520 [Polyangiaceae bacterium]
MSVAARLSTSAGVVGLFGASGAQVRSDGAAELPALPVGTVPGCALDEATGVVTEADALALDGLLDPTGGLGVFPQARRSPEERAAREGRERMIHVCSTRSAARTAALRSVCPVEDCRCGPNSAVHEF